jgi:beta-glucosidase
MIRSRDLLCSHLGEYIILSCTKRMLILPRHGLSYTTFSTKDLVLTQLPKATASVTVKNTGSVAGAQVLQLYVSAPNSETQRPVKELHGFEKVFLQPGEEKRVTIKVDPYAMSFWDESEEMWCVEEGEYRVLVDTTSREGLKGTQALKGYLKVETTKWWLGL